jgi:predicted Ser/Thr protein kinase
MSTQEQLPASLGPYRVIERLGEGGMGVVYLAEDSNERRVAVKALRPAVAADPNARRRLTREVETMRLVRSPFVAEVVDADVTCDTPYIVTRYVQGETLEDIVAKGGPLAGEKLARLASGLSLALVAVHGAGVVHRDLKPGNVMLSHGEPVVIDFGIAQVPDSTRLTQTGMFMGTPGYLAPEVIEGLASGPPSDVHSWGATVAFAATGRPPFGTGAFETIFYRIINGQPDLGGFPAPLMELVSRALSRDPGQRPTASELCLRTAALDPDTLVPGAVAATAVGPPGQGVIAGRVLGNGAAGARGIPGGPPAGALPGAAGLAGAGLAAPVSPVANGAGSPVAWPPTMPSLAIPGGAAGAIGQSPRDFRGELPPVQYAPPPPPDRSGPSAQPRGATRSPAGSLLVATCIAAAIGVSVVFPVTGTACALAVLIALRAAGRTAGRLSRWRSRRGARGSDPLLAALVFPSALAWSVVRTLLLAPLAVIAAAVAAAIALIAVPSDPVPAACAYAAGMLVLFYGFGPGSSSTREPMRKFFDAVAFTPLSAAIAFAAAAAVVVGAILVAASHPPFFWPADGLPGWLDHFGWVGHLGRGLGSHQASWLRQPRGHLLRLAR